MVQPAAFAHEGQHEHRLLVGHLREIAEVELVADREAPLLVAAQGPGQVAAAQAAALDHKAAVLHPRQH